MPYRAGDCEVETYAEYATFEVYEERTDAEAAAIVESYNDRVIAVFDCDTENEATELAGEIVSLVLQQVLYRKAD